MYVFGAACPQTGQTVGLLVPYLNTDTVNAFFRQFEKEVNPNVYVFMIWDQAGFHTSSLAKTPKNLTFVPLPPDSPQLNPVEKLWQYLLKHYWSNRVYEDYDALRIAAIEPWQHISLDKGEIKSIYRAKYVESEFNLLLQFYGFKPVDEVIRRSRTGVARSSNTTNINPKQFI